MSGRVRTTLADGRRVTGYRKTLRQSPRTRPENIPEWVVRMQLPDELAFSVSIGKTSVAGVTVVIPGPTVEARGKNREWALKQMQTYVSRIGKGLIAKVSAVVTRDGYPGPTDGAPWRPAVSRVVSIEVK